MSFIPILSMLIIGVYSGQIVLQDLVTQQKVFIQPDPIKHPYSIMLGDEKNLFYLNDSGVTIEYHLLHHWNLDHTRGKVDGICQPQAHTVNFIQTPYSFLNVLAQDPQGSVVDFDPVNGPQLSEQIQNLVRIKGGAALITTELNVYIYSFSIEQATQTHKPSLVKRVELKSYRQKQETQNDISSLAQLAFHPKSQNLYVIFNDQIIQMKVNLNNTNDIVSEINNKYLQNFGTVDAVKTSPDFLYICTQSQVYVYHCDLNGQLELKDLIDSDAIYHKQTNINLADISVGGKNGELLYVLDRIQGVTIFKIQMFGFQYQKQINSNIGLISIQQGFKLDQYKDKTLIVLTEGAGIMHQRAIDIKLNLEQGEWFRVNDYILDGRVSDVDISERIAIIRGVDSHRVLFHSVWSEFKVIKSKDYFYAPQLRQLDFYEENYGNDDNNLYNQIHSFIYGVNRREIIIYPWEELGASVICQANDNLAENYNFFYTLFVNTTDCEEKRKAQIEIPEISKCYRQIDFTVQVQGVLIGSVFGKVMAYVGIGLSILIILIIILLFVRLYRRYQLKKSLIQQEIQGFVNKGFKLDESMTQKGSENDL